MKELKNNLFKLKLICEIKIFLVSSSKKKKKKKILIHFLYIRNLLCLPWPLLKIFPSSTTANKMEVSSMTRIYELPRKKKKKTKLALF